MTNRVDPLTAEPLVQGPRRVWILVLDRVHLLDMGGPVQAISEANHVGAQYHMSYVGPSDRVRSAQGLALADLEPLPVVRDGDWILIPGTDSAHLAELDIPVDWLRDAHERGARLSTVCTGAFALAAAGLLAGRSCTTHWKLVNRLSAAVPSAEVFDNRLFVTDGQIVTSAGVAAGIDMALHLITVDYGPRVAAHVARELVLYIRRSGESTQHSVYLEHRSHLHPAVHRVQDYILEHPEERPTIEELADIAALSPRHLTRVFREATGTTLKAFGQKVKLQIAEDLATNPELTVEAIANRCGFADGRQLRRLWRTHFGSTLRDSRKGSH